MIFFESLGKAIALPDCSNWTFLLVAICIYALFTLALGLVSGFLQWNLCTSSTTIVRIIVTSLIAPACLEEILFRVGLLPYPGENIALPTYLTWAILSLFLFVIYHPLNALTFFPQGRDTFFNPIFLCLAAGLGIICTITYYQTGSLWLPVLIHWLTVVVWLLCFDGLTKLKFL